MKWYKIAWVWGCCLLMFDSVGAIEGVLDTSFNPPEGYVLWDSGDGYDRARDVALQQDGKVVVTGYKTNGLDNDIAVFRLEPNGVLDPNFGDNGIALYDGASQEQSYETLRFSVTIRF